MSQLFFSLAAFIFIGHYWPYESRFTNLMETFTEICIIFVLYTVIIFSDFTEIEAGHYAGFAFIAIVTLYICVHLFFMLRDSFQRVKTCCKSKICKKKANKKEVKEKKNDDSIFPIEEKDEQLESENQDNKRVKIKNQEKFMNESRTSRIRIEKPY